MQMWRSMRRRIYMLLLHPMTEVNVWLISFFDFGALKHMGIRSSWFVDFVEDKSKS
jgi:hypothetical protein